MPKKTVKKMEKVKKMKNDVNVYSRAVDGDKKLSANFCVREFACKDGTDKILISDALVELLQAIRDRFGAPVIISSGYRTPAHDKRIGGSGSGYHTKGMAADIYISSVPPIKIAAFAQSLLGRSGGVECGAYSFGGYVHVDVRDGKWRAVKSGSSVNYQSVSTLFPAVRIGSRSQSVTILQRELKRAGFDPGSADGICGARTKSAIISYQRSKGLDPDGICGKKTWSAICEI